MTPITSSAVYIEASHTQTDQRPLFQLCSNTRQKRRSSEEVSKSRILDILIFRAAVQFNLAPNSLDQIGKYHISKLEPAKNGVWKYISKVLNEVAHFQVIPKQIRGRYFDRLAPYNRSQLTPREWKFLRTQVIINRRRDWARLSRSSHLDNRSPAHLRNLYHSKALQKPTPSFRAFSKEKQNYLQGIYQDVFSKYHRQSFEELAKQLASTDESQSTQNSQEFQEALMINKTVLEPLPSLISSSPSEHISADFFLNTYGDEFPTPAFDRDPAGLEFEQLFTKPETYLDSETPSAAYPILQPSDPLSNLNPLFLPKLTSDSFSSDSNNDLVECAQDYAFQSTCTKDFGTIWPLCEDSHAQFSNHLRPSDFQSNLNLLGNQHTNKRPRSIERTDSQESVRKQVCSSPTEELSLFSDFSLPDLELFHSPNPTTDSVTLLTLLTTPQPSAASIDSSNSNTDFDFEPHSSVVAAYPFNEGFPQLLPQDFFDSGPSFMSIGTGEDHSSSSSPDYEEVFFVDSGIFLS